jgi:hypothetical protein
MRRGWAACALAMTFCGCARAPSNDVAPARSAAVAPSTTASASTPAVDSASGIGGGTVDAAPSPTATASTASAVEAPLEGLELLPQARAIFRVAACGPSGDVPSRFDAAVVAHHCDELRRAYDEYKRAWVDVAEPFLASLRPRDLPPVVVYPFGGGDLVSALATFPDATEITTISLEPAGDVRPVDVLAPDRLAHELAVHRSHLERLFEKAHSRTDNLAKEARTELPGEILFALAALVVHGDEPTSLRYFHLRPDGSVVYVTQADVDAAKKPAAIHALFENAELRFRHVGDAGQQPVQVLRHMSYNLDDAHLKADPSLLAHLSAKGKVAAMTKAATHLLWNEHFRLIRGWLVGHTDWMVSDSTGLPPRIASAEGFTQDTYGVFDGPSPFGDPDGADAQDLERLFASEPSRALPFRYGYPDSHGHGHLIVTHRPAR